MQTQKYYSIFDRDTGNYMATGSNSKTIKEASLALFDYMEYSGDFGEDTEQWKKEAENSPQEFANSFNFEIQELDHKINYDEV